MSPHQSNMYQLAENLHMTVTRMSSEMTMAEYFGWMQFYDDKAKDAAREAKGLPKRPAGKPGDGVVLTGFGL